jgi:hypothetical protein
MQSAVTFVQPEQKLERVEKVRKIPMYQISFKYIQPFSIYFIRIDRQTDEAILTDTPKNSVPTAKKNAFPFQRPTG